MSDCACFFSQQQCHSSAPSFAALNHPDTKGVLPKAMASRQSYFTLQLVQEAEQVCAAATSLLPNLYLPVCYAMSEVVEEEKEKEAESGVSSCHLIFSH